MEIDHEIFSMVILSDLTLQLIQEGQFSVSGERKYTNTDEPPIYRGLSLPRKNVIK